MNAARVGIIICFSRVKTTTMLTIPTTTIGIATKTGSTSIIFL